ncbi:MAG: hypothetical protein ABI925_03310, partial [Verrucomicrobiota bacterium]
MRQLRNIATDVALMRYPFRVFGIDFARNVTLIRLRDERVVIHSTAPFAAADVDTIRNFGKPSWIVDATLMHDTFAKEGRKSFPDIPYLAPPGFSEVAGVTTELLFPAPADWAGQIDVVPIKGLRKHEHALFHRQSRTLIVADLIFHFAADTCGWARFFVRHVMRLPRLQGISVFFRMLISNREAFEGSMATLLDLDFDRMIVAHAEPVEKDARALLKQALRDRGFA